MNLDDAVKTIKGVGDKKALLLAKLGISSIRDLLYYVPRAYETEGQSCTVSALKPDEKYSITAKVAGTPNTRRIRNGITLTTFSLEDETGSVEAVFFNQPYMSRMYKTGDEVYISGKTKRIGRKLQFTNPHIEKAGAQHEGMSAVYALTAGLTQKTMRIIMKNVVQIYSGIIQDVFSDGFRKQHGLAEVNYAVRNIHFPMDEEALAKAKYRLLFEELLLFNIALMSIDQSTEKHAVPLQCDQQSKQLFLDKLGYTPTGAQQRVMAEIEQDIAEAKPMTRLLQGDVGSGKTTPAFFAMFICAKSGMQSVMMAPTEVLAKQHFLNAQTLFHNDNTNIELITGSTIAAQKRVIYENVACGLTDIVIGTHAVLYDRLQFANLGLIITDEQHRFGVGQRAMLENKSEAPHTLIMSATPIPRTLALILYGKTDISVIDEMPPGRQPVKTFCIPERKRKDMYGFMEEEIERGAQIFVVCPLVEQNEDLNVRSSEEVFETLSKRFGKDRVALLHGRMKPQEKNDIMHRFKQKEFNVLVSTTVIEVGVDVPNATIMLIENAERFGLAQLHQLRGRVGRGKQPAYCFLMCQNKDNERLKILTKTNDGFVIAEEDLKLRGPGQFLGSKQSGVSDLYMANLIKDMKLLKHTQMLAKQIFKEDKTMYRKLEKTANLFYKERFKNITSN